MNTEFRRTGWGNSNFKNTLQSGSRLQDGKYIISEVCGQGLFTICYLARQTILGKRVIINEFFLSEFCSRLANNQVVNEKVDENIYRNFRDRWFEEPIIVSKCTGNEHFAAVLDTFEENNTVYYVSEYINEENLQTFTFRQKEKCLTETRAINFITQIAEGLSFLHANNIFHLDLCPYKIIIDKSDKAVIIGLGIARQKIPSEILSDHIIPAKPGYSAPELYHTDQGYGVFSDIYSVGAILYFLLTGIDPLPAPERAHKLLPEPKSVNPSVTHCTNSAVMKAMAMDHHDRYQNLNDFLNDLQKDSHKRGHPKTKKIVLYSAVALAVVVIISFTAMIKFNFNFNHDKPAKKDSGMIDNIKVNRLNKLAQLSLNEDKIRGMTLLKDPDAKDSILIGKYYALLIGIGNYEDSRYQKLSEPVNDVKAMYDILVNNYTFEKTNVLMLTDPDKKEIFQSLNFYRENLSPNDNLFVFYAGHGCYDKKANMGYLIPADADYKNDAGWISFQEVRKKFEVIEAKHILMIADACFAGSIFRGGKSDAEEGIDEMILEQLSKKSRTAFTSADLKPVPDKSEFLKQMISILRNNRARLLMSEDLYINTRNSLIRSTSIKDPVKWGVLQDCGDEGGDFTFIRRTIDQ